MISSSLVPPAPPQAPTLNPAQLNTVPSQSRPERPAQQPVVKRVKMNARGACSAPTAPVVPARVREDCPAGCGKKKRTKDSDCVFSRFLHSGQVSGAGTLSLGQRARVQWSKMTPAERQLWKPQEPSESP